MKPQSITTLFLDVGGVLLTNGWDHEMRKNAAEVFNLDPTEMERRHKLTFEVYELGKMSLDEYLNYTIFYTERPFSQERFKEFMFEQSQPFQHMIDLIRHLKARYKLKIVLISNEGRELMENRIKKFHLYDFVDIFIVSCYVHFIKPDKEIYKIALDLAHVNPSNVVYVEDRDLFVETAKTLGIQSIQHSSYESTLKILKTLTEGLQLAVL